MAAAIGLGIAGPRTARKKKTINVRTAALELDGVYGGGPEVSPEGRRSTPRPLATRAAGLATSQERGAETGCSSRAGALLVPRRTLDLGVTRSPGARSLQRGLAARRDHRAHSTHRAGPAGDAAD